MYTFNIMDDVRVLLLVKIHKTKVIKALQITKKEELIYEVWQNAL